MKDEARVLASAQNAIDEIDDVPKEEIFLMESMLRKTMGSALKLKVPLSVDISYADNWGDLK